MNGHAGPARPHGSGWVISEDKFLTKQEVRHLTTTLAKLAKDGGRKARVRWIAVHMGLVLGLRASELADLQIRDVFVGHGQGSILVRNGKGGKTANVLVPDRLRAHLRQFLAWRGSDVGPVLISKRGRAYTRSGIYRMVKGIFKDLGLRDSLNVHSLRHTAATQLLQAGNDIRLVQTLLRHSSIQTTTVYAQVINQDLRAALDKLDI